MSAQETSQAAARPAPDPRLTLVIPSLTSGGAERVMATLANAWAAAGAPVTLLTLFPTSQDFYELDSAVKYRSLGISGRSAGPIHAVRNNLRRLRVLRREIAASHPEIVLSFLDTTNVLTLLATRGLGVPVIVEEHTDPARKRLGAPWRQLRRVLYPKAARVVMLSAEAAAFFPPAIRQTTVVIPNPIAVESTARVGPATSDGRRRLVTMGRFSTEKGFDLLLEAFARVASRHPNWDLTIWGDGALRSALERQRADLGLKGRVSLPGRTREPAAVLAAADLFVMSSRREGFPMALGEAMACGLPAVAFDCPSGPRQLIRHGVDGLLVPDGDVSALAEALSELMGDDDRRAALAARAPEVRQRFGLEQVLARWAALFAEVRAGRATPERDGIRTFGRTGTAQPGTHGS